MITSDWVTVGLFALLTVIVLVLIDALRRIVPLLHDSISGSNLKPLYDALLPLARQTGQSAVQAVMIELKRKAASTATPLDDKFLGMLEEALVKALNPNADVPPTL
jgi:hypothetical protein